MKLATALEQTILRKATVVAGAHALDREISWVHIVDHPDILHWLSSGDLLLTTGYNWPRDDQACREMIRSLNQIGLAGVVLAVPHFREHFPSATVEEADLCNFPLLELPWEVPFSEITQEILAKIINLQSEIIRRSDLIHRALTRAAIEANNLNALAVALSGALELPARIVSSSGTVLGSSDPHIDEALERRFIDQLQQGKATITPLESSQPRVVTLDKPGTSTRLACPVLLQGELMGVVWLQGQGEPFEELHSRALEHAAVIAALHLTHQRELLDQETRLGYALVAGLLEGKFPETPRAIERALVSGWSESRPYRVCLLLIDEPIPLSLEGFKRRKEKAERITRIMQDLDIAPLMSVSLNQISLIVPADVPAQSIWKSLRNDGGAMAVSRVHSGVSGMALGAQDVAALLPLLRPGKLHSFNEVLFPRALMGDEDARALLIERYITPLANNKNSAMLLETVCVLANEGYQLVNSAKALNVHISTLRYRMERIETLLEVSLDKPESRFQLQVAAEMYKLAQDL
ncbi:PucR family transcriptional regulator [Pseudomonas gingeri]|uniref:PucR family transcriptional regulator n=1 Tax=Pseudomonas gingeri TaxID=117681 RepID=UPI0015A49B72|nr:PucR family transcriptional regulator [Pseudomonas gingeri]NVZ65311.1 PucR family transcriptional regulator [Pseudomonas gingeri]NVZ74094.1 PucR family transcriptional regulator [Pseudomonas gingeri]NWE48332.1 PucR family transcriptional regulator [Pseudomonas gingeri]